MLSARSRSSTFTSITELYIDYLRLCLEHLELDVPEFKPASDAKALKERNQDIIMHMAGCILESAYFRYKDHNRVFFKAQWPGWEENLRNWCKHPEFRDDWPHLVAQYDAGFVGEITKIYNAVSEKLAEEASKQVPKT